VSEERTPAAGWFFGRAGFGRRAARLTAAFVATWMLTAAATAEAKFAAIVLDAESGQVLYQAAEDAPRYPASLTKVMTLMLLFDAIDQGRLRLTTRLPVSGNAAEQSPTKLGLYEGESITVQQAILGLVTKSANDAAVVIAEALGGSEDRFADMMTRKARRIGMNNTTFQNASGLPDPNQITTARDLAIMARTLIRQYPHYYGYFSTPSFTYENATHYNHNRWMTWYNGADGIKTGFTRASGYNLAASAVRGDKRLIGIVLGGPSGAARDQEMGRILDLGFQRANGWPTVQEASVSQPVSRPPARSGAPVALRGAWPSLVASANAAPVAGARAVAAKAPAAPETWGVQVGAFAQQAQARRAAGQAVSKSKGALDDGRVILVPVTVKKQKMHRAQIMGLTESEARSSCKTLAREKIACFVVTPAAETVKAETKSKQAATKPAAKKPATKTAKVPPPTQKATPVSARR